MRIENFICINFKQNLVSLLRNYLYIAFLFFLSNGYAQVFPDIQFSRLTEKEGLSDNQVNWIEQDNDGFLWFATQDGLDRFDGYKIRSFYHIPGDKYSLVNNLVSHCFRDQQNHLWISTGEGLCRYDKRTGVFTNFRHNPADSNSLFDDQYNWIYVDHDNSAWVTTRSAVYHFDTSLHYQKVDIGFEKFIFDKRVVESYDNVTEDRQRQLWASAYHYVFLLDRKTMHVKKKFGFFPGNVLGIYQDKDMHYWVCSFAGGLSRFDPATNCIEPIDLKISTTIINSIAEWSDQNNFRWIVLGTDNGIVLLDPSSLKSKEYVFHTDLYRQNSLLGTGVQKVFVDRQNILWIATNAGVNYVEPSKQLFDRWRIYGDDEISQYPMSDNAYSCSQNSQGLWMVRWLNPCLSFFNKSGELVKKITVVYDRNKPYALTVDSSRPYYIQCDGDSMLWFTTNREIIHYNIKSGRAKFYQPSDSYNYTGFRTIVEQDKHHWWIRTRNNGGNGIYVFDPVTGKFTKHYSNIEGRSGSPPMFLLDIIISRKKEVYVTSRTEGLFKYDSATDGFVCILKFKGDEVAMHSNSFESIAEDNNGVLWIGTPKGLLAFDPVSKKVVHDYSNDSRLGGLDISALCFDEQQNLWMNSERGIFCLSDSLRSVRQFGRSEGLPNNTSSEMIKLGNDHYIYSAFRGYLVRFLPQKLLQKFTPSSDIHFSESSIMDKPYFFQYNNKGEKSMQLEPGQNRFTVDFSVLNYDDVDNNRYYYQLDGAMNQWQQNENGHLAFYNLSPGKYTLHVKGGNKYAPLQDKEDVVTIFVKPYWWQTLWFRVLSVAALVILSVILIRRRIEHIRKQAGFRQRLAETEMMALRSQMNPHFIFNSLNSIENFIMQNKKRQASDYLNKFARLIRMILENSREETVTVARDMDALQLYVDLEQLRFNNKFSYETCIDGELLDDDYRVPPLLIQPFVENAIVHGLANSDKPNLFLHVDAKLENECIKYTVEDNGVGRKQAAVYNAQNKHKYNSVGMRITKDRINIFNQQRSGNEMVIIDLYDEQGNPTGTRAEIKIKPL